MQRIFLVALALVFLGASSIEQTNFHSFFPKNDLRIPVGLKNVSKVNKVDFDKVAEQVKKHYSDVVSRLGGRLVFELKWDSAEVNAYTQRQGNDWIITLFGGLARHPKMTVDGFLLVACHELGHQIGGAPKMDGWFGKSWPSVEGQSDYFSTLKCFKRITAEEDSVKDLENVQVPEQIVSECSASFTEVNENARCQRSVLASIALTSLLDELERGTGVSINTPDRNVVTETYQKHPKAQCRLDTMYQGSLCNVEATEDMSDDDETISTCNGTERGARPACWYKSEKDLTNNDDNGSDNNTDNNNGNVDNGNGGSDNNTGDSATVVESTLQEHITAGRLSYMEYSTYFLKYGFKPFKLYKTRDGKWSDKQE